MDFTRIKDFKNPCLLFSGGLDSTLLLALLREQNVSTAIVAVGNETWTKKQKARVHNLVKRFNLKVFSFPPAGLSFIGNGENITAVYEYPVGNSTIPVLRDIVAGDKCIADLDGMRMYHSPINWDLYIVGSRKADKHYALENGVAPDREWQIGNATFLAPLYDWTRAEVQEALKERGLPWEEVDEDTDSGNLLVCDKCLRATSPIVCPADGSTIEPQGTHLQLNLANFRKRYQITH